MDRYTITQTVDLVTETKIATIFSGSRSNFKEKDIKKICDKACSEVKPDSPIWRTVTVQAWLADDGGTTKLVYEKIKSRI